ncbi:MAG: HPr family phosphocarrier protein [Verrucomicrobiota bacterium]
MPDCSLVIPNEEGLHARPAAKFVKLANQFSSEIWVRKDDEEINGKSIMGLMMLAAEQGSTIVISADGDDSEAALEKLSSLVNSGFTED